MNGLQLMVPGTARDVLLLQWWNTLHETNEVADIFDAQAASTPSSFLSLFANPTTVMFYRADDAGLKVVIWFEHFMGNAALGLWAREDYRHAQSWPDVIEAMRAVFAEVPLVLYMTKHDHVMRSGSAIGFKSMGVMPYLYRGDHSHVAYMTREMFEERHGKSRRYGE